MNLPFLNFDGPRDGLLTLQYLGEVTEEDAKELPEHVARFLEGCRGEFNVLVSLTGLSLCDMEAREHLAEVHKLLVAGDRRCVYIADRALFRGLAAYVVHMSGDDENGKIFGTRRKGMEWLEGKEGRLEGHWRNARSSYDYLRSRRAK